MTGCYTVTYIYLHAPSTQNLFLITVFVSSGMMYKNYIKIELESMLVCAYVIVGIISMESAMLYRTFVFVFNNENDDLLETAKYNNYGYFYLMFRLR